MQTSQQVEIVFHSRIEYLNLVHAVTDEMARMTGFDADTALNISLAVREAATNAVVHGNARDESKLVRIAFRTSDGILTIWVRDEGNGFEPGAVADPRDPSNLARTSGRGIFLMRSFMDSVSFVREAEDGMAVCMEKKA